MMIESIIALIGLLLLGIFVVVCWADSIYQAERREQRLAQRGLR